MSQTIDTRTTPVPLKLTGSRVMPDFRSALFDAANRAGITPNEFVITAAAEKLERSGASFPGVFRTGDLQTNSEAA
ncbi:hypothetical protein [Jiella pelagia]|uniref:HicB family protein n=1 Tax=Jiella pelagia TaxID=2986949 RepID=A0ABY7C0D7_9HYPH|nr:hypothetical protein [Jiella pelagia]WAP69309.1 hypothetical protein OH818_03140 [Jiella pelagia]